VAHSFAAPGVHDRAIDRARVEKGLGSNGSAAKYGLFQINLAREQRSLPQ
jgi:hypothetical protein